MQPPFFPSSPSSSLSRIPEGEPHASKPVHGRCFKVIASYCSRIIATIMHFVKWILGFDSEPVSHRSPPPSAPPSPHSQHSSPSPSPPPSPKSSSPSPPSSPSAPPSPTPSRSSTPEGPGIDEAVEWSRFEKAAEETLSQLRPPADRNVQKSIEICAQFSGFSIRLKYAREYEFHDFPDRLNLIAKFQARLDQQKSVFQQYLQEIEGDICGHIYREALIIKKAKVSPLDTPLRKKYFENLEAARREREKDRKSGHAAAPAIAERDAKRAVADAGDSANDAQVKAERAQIAKQMQEEADRLQYMKKQCSTLLKAIPCIQEMMPSRKEALGDAAKDIIAARDKFFEWSNLLPTTLSWQDFDWTKQLKTRDPGGMPNEQGLNKLLGNNCYMNSVLSLDPYVRVEMRDIPKTYDLTQRKEESEADYKHRKELYTEINQRMADLLRMRDDPTTPIDKLRLAAYDFRGFLFDNRSVLNCEAPDDLAFDPMEGYTRQQDAAVFVKAILGTRGYTIQQKIVYESGEKDAKERYSAEETSSDPVVTLGWSWEKTALQKLQPTTLQELIDDSFKKPQQAESLPKTLKAGDKAKRFTNYTAHRQLLGERSRREDFELPKVLWLRLNRTTQVAEAELPGLLNPELDRLAQDELYRGEPRENLVGVAKNNLGIGENNFQRLGTSVEVPMNGVLDLSSAFGGNKKAKYRLKGSVVHHSEQVGGGHYTSYVSKDGRWSHHNDESVKECEQKEASSIPKKVRDEIASKGYLYALELSE